MWLPGCPMRHGKFRFLRREPELPLPLWTGRHGNALVEPRFMPHRFSNRAFEAAANSTLGGSILRSACKHSKCRKDARQGLKSRPCTHGVWVIFTKPGSPSGLPTAATRTSARPRTSGPGHRRPHPSAPLRRWLRRLRRRPAGTAESELRGQRPGPVWIIRAGSGCRVSAHRQEPDSGWGFTPHSEWQEALTGRGEGLLPCHGRAGGCSGGYGQPPAVVRGGVSRRSRGGVRRPGRCGWSGLRR